MKNPKDASKRLHAVMNALADHTERASDQDLLDDAMAQGLDVKVEAERVRGLLLEGVLVAKKARLRRAQEDHQRAVDDIQSRDVRLPADPAERRALFMRTLHREPTLGAVLTVQHRDLESVTDDDVYSALTQLYTLGLLRD